MVQIKESLPDISQRQKNVYISSTITDFARAITLGSIDAPQFSSDQYDTLRKHLNGSASGIVASSPCFLEFQIPDDHTVSVKIGVEYLTGVHVPYGKDKWGTFRPELEMALANAQSVNVLGNASKQSSVLGRIEIGLTGMPHLDLPRKLQILEGIVKSYREIEAVSYVAQQNGVPAGLAEYVRTKAVALNLQTADFNTQYREVLNNHPLDQKQLADVEDARHDRVVAFFRQSERQLATIKTIKGLTENETPLLNGIGLMKEMYDFIDAAKASKDFIAGQTLVTPDGEKAKASLRASLLLLGLATSVLEKAPRTP